MQIELRSHFCISLTLEENNVTLLKGFVLNLSETFVVSVKEFQKLISAPRLSLPLGWVLTLGTSRSLGVRYPTRKPMPGFFLCIFSSPTCLKKPVFSKLDLLLWKVPARLYWDLLTRGRYQPACHYF